jgi:hypothetical protein
MNNEGVLMASVSNVGSSAFSDAEVNLLAFFVAIGFVLGMYCSLRYICCRSAFERDENGENHETHFRARHLRVRHRDFLPAQQPVQQEEPLLAQPEQVVSRMHRQKRGATSSHQYTAPTLALN